MGPKEAIDIFCHANEHLRVGIRKGKDTVYISNDFTEAIKAAVAALETKAEKQKPLTIAELKALPLQEWVYIEVLWALGMPLERKSGYYKKHYDYTEDTVFSCGYPGLTFGFDYRDYGETWVAYHHRPEK